MYRELIKFKREHNPTNIYEVAIKSFDNFPWSLDSLTQSINSEVNKYWILYNENLPIGFVGMSESNDFSEVLLIGIIREFQGKGYSRILMQNVIDRDQRYILEVRSKNIKAINLYNSYGFKKIGIRENYYLNPTDDALILEKRRIDE